jgi:RNA ligase (TIGR02306 family)
MATDFAVKVVRINEVVPHPNADRLDLCTIAGWQCVSQRGNYKAGDLVVYIPIDSVLPDKVERILFGPDSKIKLHKSRVKSIKIRGSISQGMLAPCTELGVPAKEGYDCTKELGISKYEPPEAPPSMRGGNPVSKKKKNPFFKEYGGLDNFKNYPELFKEGEEVIITEKIHGTNFRFGWVPAATDTFTKKVKKFFGVLPEYEFVFGSNKVQLQNRVSSGHWKAKMLGWIPIKAIRTIAYQGYYEQSGVGNVYEEAVKKYDLKNITEDPRYRGCVFYGEIYGSSVQKDYAYGCAEGERKLVMFDIMCTEPGMRTGEAREQFEAGFCDHHAVESVCEDLGLDVVPILYRGPFDAKKAKELTKGNSVMVPTQKVREGVVIRPAREEKCHMGRKVLKLISDDYLLGDNTDFH